MCGIVGYIGDNKALPFLLKGLEKLEYRGYDSSGVSILSDGKIHTFKKSGRLKILSENLKNEANTDGKIGIGHTRWATHGEPSDVNAHPQISNSGRISVIHNGIIENYISLKKFLIGEGFKFYSDTDTEVVAQLIDYCYNGDFLDAVKKAVRRLDGSYALGIICRDEPDKLIAVKKDSPLILGTTNNENYLASDIAAVLDKTKNIYRLKENEIAVIKKDSIDIYSGETQKKLDINKDFTVISWDIDPSEKGNYEHFMIKEIMEQPKVLKNTISPHINEKKIEFKNIKFPENYLSSLSKIYIVACGSAYHVGFTGKYIIEKLTRIPVEVDLASEFRYKQPILDKSVLVLVISQSGETADSLAALREAKRHNCKVLSIVNVVGSSIDNESDYVIHTSAGPEIAVATTKAYSAQLSVIYMFALYLANKFHTISDEIFYSYINELVSLPNKVEEILGNNNKIASISENYKNINNAFFIGRTLDYAVCMEGSLKLKEISYIHSEAYAAGELKHGTISLIENGTLVISILTQDELFDKSISNIREVKARGATVFAITTEEYSNKISQTADEVFYVPKTLSLFSPSLSVIPLQLFSYYIALARGCDIDKPRNLAKSVTVE